MDDARSTLPDPRSVRPFVWLFDRRPLYRDSLRLLLQDWAAGHGLELVTGDWGEGPAALDERPGCRLVLVSVGGADIGGAPMRQWLDALREQLPETPVAVIADGEDARGIHAVFDAGGRGYLTSALEPDVARGILSLVLAGGSYVPPAAFLHGRDQATPATGSHAGDGSKLALTERQRAVLRCLHEGKSNKMIARELDMRESTVKVHVRSILRKLGAINRTQAALAAGTVAGFERTAEEPPPVAAEPL
jgi:DNA-binding NarL/FixJ family response regulator